MKISKKNLIAGLLAGGFAVSALFAGVSGANAAEKKQVAPKVKETAVATAANLQAILSRTLNASQCVAHITMTIMNKGDYISIESHNKVAGDVYHSLIEGEISGTSRIEGRENRHSRPYYLTREGSEFAAWSNDGAAWTSNHSEILGKMFGGSFGLYEVLGRNGSAKLLNDTGKSRTIFLKADPRPFADFFRHITAIGGSERLLSVDTASLKKLTPVDVTVYVDKETQRITDANADVSNVIKALLAAVPAMPEDTEAQRSFRQMLHDGIVNLHISISNYDKTPNFGELPAEIAPLPAAGLKVEKKK